MATERMPDPATLVPGAMAALRKLGEVIAGAGLDGRLLALSRLRAGQINGSGRCVADGADRARRHGATGEQLHSVAAWRDATCFSAEERAALALTEAVTRLADNPDAVPDELWDVAATYFDQKELAVLLLNIAEANAVSRLNAPSRRQACRPMR